jgi:uncharacterized protein (UPF0297 family)
MGDFDNTIRFGNKSKESAAGILTEVYAALQEKGYDPINQLVGYLMSGDPVYITSHNQARNRIRQIERHELLEELVKEYLKTP